MKQLKVRPRELFGPALRGTIQRLLNRDGGKSAWHKMPKREEDAMYGLDEFVQQMIRLVALMNSILYDMKMKGHVIFAEDSQTMENNLFQLFIDDAELLRRVSKLTGSIPRSILLNTYGFKSWDLYFENIDDFSEFIANFLSPIKKLWQATQP